MSEDIYTSLGSVIRKFRKKKGFTHEDLGKLIGLSRPSVIRIESGKKKIYFHELNKIMAAVDLNYTQLESELSNVDIRLKIENQAISKSDQATLLKSLSELL